MDLAEADLSKLKHHSDFNITAMSFSAGELAESIRQYKPDFKVTYEPDFRQAIADSWPRSLDDSAAREEWGWEPEYDLDAMTRDIEFAESIGYVALMTARVQSPIKDSSRRVPVIGARARDSR